MAYVTLEDLAGGLGQIKTPAQLEAEAGVVGWGARGPHDAARAAAAPAPQSSPPPAPS